MSSNKDKAELLNEIEQLTRHLNRLSIEKEIIERKLLLAHDNLQNGTMEHVTNRNLPDLYKDHTNEYSTKKKLEAGDFVQILNPKPGQEKYGRIVGFYKDGKVKICTEKQLIIRRLPHNINYMQNQM